MNLQGEDSLQSAPLQVVIDHLNGLKSVEHVQEMITARFAPVGAGEQRLQEVEIDLYDMGSPLHAFGVFSAQRTPESERVLLGAEAFREGSVLALWKGPYFARVVTLEEGEDAVARLKALAHVLGEQLPGTTDKPRLARAFPQAGLIERSIAYVPAHVLDREFLPGGFTARYATDGAAATAFVAEFPTAAAASQALALWRTAHEQQGGRVELSPAIGAEGFIIADSSAGQTVVFRKRHRLAGVVGLRGETLRDIPAQVASRL